MVFCNLLNMLMKILLQSNGILVSMFFLKHTLLWCWVRALLHFTCPWHFTLLLLIHKFHMACREAWLYHRKFYCACLLLYLHLCHCYSCLHLYPGWCCLVPLLVLAPEIVLLAPLLDPCLCPGRLLHLPAPGPCL